MQFSFFASAKIILAPAAGRHLRRPGPLVSPLSTWGVVVLRRARLLYVVQFNIGSCASVVPLNTFPFCPLRTLSPARLSFRQVLLDVLLLCLSLPPLRCVPQTVTPDCSRGNQPGLNLFKLAFGTTWRQNVLSGVMSTDCPGCVDWQQGLLTGTGRLRYQMARIVSN